MLGKRNGEGDEWECFCGSKAWQFTWFLLRELVVEFAALGILEDGWEGVEMAGWDEQR